MAIDMAKRARTIFDRCSAVLLALLVALLGAPLDNVNLHYMVVAAVITVVFIIVCLCVILIGGALSMEEPRQALGTKARRILEGSLVLQGALFVALLLIKVNTDGTGTTWIIETMIALVLVVVPFGMSRWAESAVITPLHGVALVPRPRDLEAVVGFRHAASTHVAGPELGTETNLPHLSLFQAPIPAEALTEDALHLIRSAVDGPVLARWGACYHQPRGWVFCDATDPELVALHSQAVTALSGFVDHGSVQTPDDYDTYTDDERRALESYGYRYALSAFLPHVTLGRLPEHDEDLHPDVASDWGCEHAGEEVAFDRLVAYRAGDFGACAEILAEVRL